MVYIWYYNGIKMFWLVIVGCNRAKLVNVTSITMVYDTYYYLVYGSGWEFHYNGMIYIYMVYIPI